jgi:choline kinase
MTYKALIPCAGFGTRMRMLPHEAKELLLDEDGNITIEWSLELCKKHNIDPAIITRPEKEEFNNYIRNKEIPFVYPTGASVGESILSSRELWGDYNIILLPDTRFEYPETLFQDMLNSMKLGNECVFALFNVTDYQNWGVLCENTFYEKPKRVFEEKDNAFAWGVFGFRKSYGETLLTHLNTFSDPLKLSNPGYFFINNFRDISRKY